MIGRLVSRAFILATLGVGAAFGVAAQGLDVAALWAATSPLQRCGVVGGGLVVAAVVLLLDWRWDEGGWNGGMWSSHDGCSNDGDCGCGDGGCGGD